MTNVENVAQAFFKVIHTRLKMLIKHSICRDISIAIILIYVVISPTCGEEYTDETGVGKTSLRDSAWLTQALRKKLYKKYKTKLNYL